MLGLLILSGPVTTVPLLFFAAAARRLRLSTMGILKYLSPSLQFLVAVAILKEPFSRAQLISFACIWIAIGVYTADSFRAMQQGGVALVEPFGALIGREARQGGLWRRLRLRLGLGGLRIAGRIAARRRRRLRLVRPLKAERVRCGRLRMRGRRGKQGCNPDRSAGASRALRGTMKAQAHGRS